MILKFKKRKAVTITALLCLSLSGASAAYTSATAFEMPIHLDTVDIELENGSGGTNQEAARTIRHPLTIKNKGARCFLRARCISRWKGSNAEQGIKASINKSGWITAEDGWTYRLQPFEDGEFETITETIEVPLEGPTQNASSLESTVVVEAIQADGFQPNFTEFDPWLGNTAEKTIHSRKEEEEWKDFQ